MAPIKLEENIKDKLEKRVLNSSENAWNSLEQKLDAQNKKQKGTIFWWYGIAASIICGLLIIQQYRTTDFQIENEVPVIVDIKKIESKSPASNNQIVQEDKKKNSIPKKASNSNKKKENISVEPRQNVKKENAIVEAKGVKNKENKKTKIISDVFLSKNAIEKNSIAETKTVEDVSNSTTDLEIDALLSQAMRNINKENRAMTNNSAVNGNALLQEVEIDIEHSIRGKAIKIIEKNYKTIKNAVASRND